MSMTTTATPSFCRFALAAAAACCAFVGVNAWAQASGDTTLLRGKAVTESNVLDALTPGAVDADVAVRTRSLKVSPDNSAAQAVLAPRKKPSASLLITFETNSAELTTFSRSQLDVVGAALKNERLKDFTFSVEGHADARGSSEANRILSQQRAEAVRRYLISERNVPAEKLQAIGKGDSEPMNTRDIAAAENRRVTIVTNTQ